MRKHGAKLALRRLWATGALALALGVGGSGCGDPPDSITSLRPEGDPEVMQVFLNVRDADGAVQMALAAGEHPDWDGLVAEPMVTNALLNDEQLIRVVVDELLDGSTLENFACACNHPATATAPAGVCESGPLYSADPSLCGNDSTTTDVNENGLWLDVTFDGQPDNAALLDGVASFDCGNGNVVEIGGEQGYYIPSGSQFVSTILGITLWDTLGPAVVLIPGALPASSTCSLAFATSVVDKEGNAIPAPDFAFQTEDLQILGQTPAVGADGALDQPFSVTFNASLDPVSVTAANVTITPALADVVIEADPGNPGSLLITPPAAGFAADTTYTVTVTTGVTESFGIGLPAAATLTFSTAAL
jgi:hypothetical protein